MITTLAQTTCTMTFHIYFSRPILQLPFRYPWTDYLLSKWTVPETETWQHQETWHRAGAETLFPKEKYTLHPGAKPQELYNSSAAMQFGKQA